MYAYIYIYIYIYIYTHTSVPFSRSPSVLRGERAGQAAPWLQWTPQCKHNFNKTTVSFHNFKSQNFKLSVSNLKNKYVAHLSVLSQISNCQSLGHKNKHEILKTDRNTT